MSEPRPRIPRKRGRDLPPLAEIEARYTFDDSTRPTRWPWPDPPPSRPRFVQTQRPIEPIQMGPRVPPAPTFRPSAPVRSRVRGDDIASAATSIRSGLDLRTSYIEAMVWDKQPTGLFTDTISRSVNAPSGMMISPYTEYAYDGMFVPGTRDVSIGDQSEMRRSQYSLLSVLEPSRLWFMSPAASGYNHNDVRNTIQNSIQQNLNRAISTGVYEPLYVPFITYQDLELIYTRIREVNPYISSYNMFVSYSVAGRLPSTADSSPEELAEDPDARRIERAPTYPRYAQAELEELAFPMFDARFIKAINDSNIGLGRGVGELELEEEGRGQIPSDNVSDAYGAGTIQHSFFITFFPRGKSFRGGAFYPYIVDIGAFLMRMEKEDLERLLEITNNMGILNTSSVLEPKSTLCLELAINRALVEQGQAPITIPRKYIVRGRVETRDLDAICHELKIQILLKRCRASENINTRIKGSEKHGKEGPEVSIFLINDHYIHYQRTIEFSFPESDFGPEEKKKRRWSTREFLVHLHSKGYLRMMTPAEISRCRPEEDKIENYIEGPLDELELSAKYDTGTPGDYAQHTISELIDMYQVYENSEPMSEEVKKERDKEMKKINREYKSRYPFKGKPYYVVGLDTETCTRRDTSLRAYTGSFIVYRTKRQISRGLNEFEGEEVYGLETYKKVGKMNCYHEEPGIYLKQMLKNLTPMEGEVNAIIIAHNLGFDMPHVMKTFGAYNKHLGSRAKPKMIDYYREYDKIKHHWSFRDSLNVTGCSLAEFPARFGLTGEMVQFKFDFPYTFYGEEIADMLKVARGEVVSTFHKLLVHMKGYTEKPQNMEQEKRNAEAEENLRKAIDLSQAWITRPSGLALFHSYGPKLVDVKKLVTTYCDVDVEIMLQGWMKFNEDLEKDMGMPGARHITTAGWAFSHMLQHGALSGCAKLGGALRSYISNSIYGGRCLSRDNKAWMLQADPENPNSGWIYFDGVSLYPSAMEEIGEYPQGAPDLITDSIGDIRAARPKAVFYVLTVDIKENPNPLPFPILARKGEDGNTEYSNDHRGLMVLNMYDVEVLELFGFQEGRDFDIKRGVFWFTSGGNLRQVITEMFERRAILKDEKSRKPDGSDYTKEERKAQGMIKLCMNSCFGKKIQKCYQKNATYYVTTKENRIEILKEISEKYGDNLYSYETIFSGKLPFLTKQGKIGTREETHIIVTTTKSAYDYKNYCHLGSAVLSKARQIMARVFWSIYELEKKLSKPLVYYTDTDSILVDAEIIEDGSLKSVYYEKFGRELEGTWLGQFHSDFEPPAPHDKSYLPRSIKSCIIGKKNYCHLVQYKKKDGSFGTYYHNRMKGIPESIVRKLTLTDYERMYYGHTNTFDLLEGGKRVRFKYNKTKGEMKQVHKFKRKVKCLQVRSDEEDHFKASLTAILERHIGKVARWKQMKLEREERKAEKLKEKIVRKFEEAEETEPCGLSIQDLILQTSGPHPVALWV